MNKLLFEKTKKPFNFRSPLLIAAFLILGIALAVESIIITAVVVGILLAFVFILYFLVRSKKFLFICALTALFFCYGYISTYATIDNSGKLYFNQVEITARIANNDGNSLTFDNVTIQGEKYKGKMKYSLNYITKKSLNEMISSLKIDDITNSDDLITGKTIVFYGDIQEIKLSSDPIIAAQYQKGIRFNLIKLRNIHEIGQGKLFFNEIILMSFEQKLKNNLKPETYGVLSAILFGDKSNIEESLLDDFKTNGLIHLFAVSGLHVGILSSLVFLFLKIIRMPRAPRYTLTSIAVIFYAYLCGFTPSVTRASIMLLTYYLTRLLLAPPDTLSSLAFSAIIILLLSPISLFGMSFAMSFVAVFAILLAGNCFTFLFPFLPRKVAQLLSISLSVNIMMLPIFLYVFKGYSIIYIIANLIFIPLMPLVFSLGFVLLFVSFIPYFAPLLSILDIACRPIIWLNEKFASLPFSYVETPNLSPFLVLTMGAIIFVLFIIASKYIFCAQKNKKYCSCAVLCLYIIFFVVSSAQSAIYPNTITNKNYGDIYVIDTGSAKYAISLTLYDRNTERKLKYLSNNTNISKFDKVFLLGVSEEYRENISQIGDYKIIDNFEFFTLGVVTISFSERHMCLALENELIIIARPDLMEQKLTNQDINRLYNAFGGDACERVNVFLDINNYEKYKVADNVNLVKKNLNNFTIRIKNDRMLL